MGRATMGGNVNPWVSFPDYMDYRDQAESLASLATIGGGAGSVTVTGTDEPEQANITFVTRNLFETLGVAPILGGTFSIEELPQNGPGEVVISHSFWQSWFGGDPDVVGRTLTVDGSSTTVVGVMPPGFRFMYDVDLWSPPWPGNSRPITRRYHNWLLVGRLAPGATLEEARAEVDVISVQLQEAYPDSNRRKALQLDGLQTAMVEGYRQSILILVGSIVLVLLIACSNVASLLMARGSARVSELAVRSAMGAGRFRLTRQLLVECLILALTSGVAGVLLAMWLQDLILGFVSLNLLGIEELGVSFTMLGIALALSVGTVLLFGVYPSFSAARANPAADLKEGSRGSTAGGGVRFRSGLVVLQVALSLVLLVGSGLLLKSFARLSGVDPGFRVENLLTARLDLPADRYANAEDRIVFFKSLEESILGLPGVESVGFSTHLPILQTAGNVAIWAPDRPPETNNDAPWADRRIILPDYFETMEIPLVDGRFFDDTDDAGAPPVIILSRTTADLVYPEAPSVGRDVAVDVGADEPGIFRVVGVVEDHQTSSLAGNVRPAMFFPHAQLATGSLSLAVATGVAPTSLIRPIQERIWDMNRDIILSGPQTMEEAIANSVAGRRSVTTILSLFTAVAMGLAALGLYGVLAFLVAQKVHEIGIRVALGASRGAVMRLVMSKGMLLVAGGLVLGIVGALASARLVDGMLFQTTTTDPGTYTVVTAAFVLVALVACFVPARRAIRVDPVDAFRSE
jgi:putative ABC transport system permease protein